MASCSCQVGDTVPSWWGEFTTLRDEEPINTVMGDVEVRRRPPWSKPGGARIPALCLGASQQTHNYIAEPGQVGVVDGQLL